MKVAFFVNAFPMMSEAFIANAAAALIDAGHTVDIIGLGNTDTTGLSVPEAGRLNLEQCTTNIRWPARRLKRWQSLPVALWSIASKHGLKGLARLKPQTYRRTFANLSAIYQAGQLPVNGDYDILHCQFATLAEHVIKHRKAGFLTGRLIVNFRGYDITEVVKAKGPHVYDNIWPEADGYIANCEYFRQRAIDIGCPEDRISVVGSGIRLDSFPYQPKQETAPAKPSFLMVGRLIQRKGFHIALPALGRFVQTTGKPVHVDIVGNGPMRQELETLARDCGLEGMVTFHGAQDHKAIAGFLEKCDIFLAPCVTCPKGGQDAPVNTIKEAMAMGRPVVATRHGGIPELVSDGETGLLCEEGDIESLENAIHRMLASAPLWDGMLKTAQEAVEQRYALEKTNHAIMRVYESVLDRAPTNTTLVSINPQKAA